MSPCILQENQVYFTLAMLDKITSTLRYEISRVVAGIDKICLSILHINRLHIGVYFLQFNVTEIYIQGKLSRLTYFYIQ